MTDETSAPARRRRTPAPAAGTKPAETPAATPPAAPAETPAVTPPATSETPAEQPQVDTAEDASELVDVRVLVAFGDNLPNDVIALPRSDALALEEQNQVDGHPAAVAYARELQG